MFTVPLWKLILKKTVDCKENWTLCGVDKLWCAPKVDICHYNVPLVGIPVKKCISSKF